MKTTPPLPLNYSQRNRLIINLASIERNLAELREIMECPPEDLLLTRFEDKVPPHLAPALEAAVADVNKEVRDIASRLQLEPLRAMLRRSVSAKLLLDQVDIHDARPSGGLRGYGRVPSQTAEYLEPALDKLEESLRKLIALLDTTDE
jgi:hypothetical protein